MYVHESYFEIYGIRTNNLSIGTNSYFENIFVLGENFSAEDIESIELVDPENEDIVIATLEGNLKIEYSRNIMATMKVEEEPEIGKEYIYVIKLKNNIEIRPRYYETENGKKYNVTLRFVDEAQIGGIHIFDGLNMYDNDFNQDLSVFEFSKDKLEFSLHNILNLKEEDLENLEVQISNFEGDIIASVDGSSMDISSHNGNVNYLEGQIAIDSTKIEENHYYALSVKYSSETKITKLIKFTNDLMVNTMYIAGDIVVEKDANSFEVILENALNIEKGNISLVMVRQTSWNGNYDFSQSIDLEVELLENNNHYDDDYYYRGNKSRYYLKTSLEGKDVPVGFYTLFLKSNDNLVSNVNTNIRVTDKSMVLRGSEYVFDEGFITEYVIRAVNLQRDASYKVYVYPNHYYNEYHGHTNGSYSQNRDLIMTLDKVSIDKNGNVIFTAEELIDLKEGSYSLFFEMNNRIIGEGYLDVKEYREMDKASFMINGGRRATDKRDVSLQITLGKYFYVRFADTENALKNMEYVKVSNEELEAKLALREFTLSSEFGEKTIYLQLKDEDGKESNILSQKITLEPEALKPPFDLKYIGNDEIVENDTIVIEVKGKENMIARASLLDDKGEVISTITLPNVGQDNELNNVFRRSIQISGNLVNISTIRVYFENSVGTKSEHIDLDINVSKLAKVDATLTRSHAGEEKPVSFASVILERKSGESFVRVGSRTTDREGKIAFNGLANGDYRFVTYHSGIEYTQEFSISGSDKEINFVITSEFDKAQNIRVVLEDNSGARLIGKNIAIGSSDTATYRNMETNEDGVALFENLPTKDGGVEYYISTYVDGLSKWELVNLKPDNEAEVTLKLPTVSTIKGRVADKDGKGIKDVTVFANSQSFRYSYGYTDTDGNYEIKILDHREDETYRVQISLNSGAKLFPVSNNSNVSVGSEDVDFTLYPGVNVYGDIKDASGQGLSNVQVWASSSSQWNNATTDENGEFDFGDSFGIGTHTVSTWVNGQQISQTVEITKDDLTSEEPVSKKVELRLEDRTAHPFRGEGNSVRSNVSTTQKGKQFTVKASIKNNSTRDLNAVELQATLPENVVLVENTPGFENLSTKNLGTIKAGQSGEMTMILKATEEFDSSSIVIPVKVNADGADYNLGFAEIEVVNITITGPTLSRGDIRVYGETVEGGRVTIIDKVDGKALASATPSGKWYSSRISLEDGEYEIIAMVEKDGNIAYSEILKVKVNKSDGIEVEDVEIISSGGQRIGVNRRTGIAAFSVWVDMQLRGKDIDARVKLDAEDGVIEEAKYLFTGKEYKATLNSEGYYQAKITNWSASTSQKLKLFVKVEGNWIEFTVADITILIDPSGYVEDKHSLERLEGALAICEVWDEDENEWVFWDAEIFGQVNPQLTDSNGEYGWMVPDGIYRVRITKDGYEDYVTTEDPKYSADGESTIIIPPPRDDVNISMINISQPTVKDAEIKGKVITFNLNKAIDKATVNNETVVVKDDVGATVSGALTVSSNNKNIIFTADTEFGSEIEYSLSIDGVKDFAGLRSEAKTLVYVGAVVSEKITTPGDDNDTPGDDNGSETPGDDNNTPGDDNGNETPGDNNTPGTPGGSSGGSSGGGGGAPLAPSKGSIIKVNDGGTIRAEGLLVDFLGGALNKDFVVRVEKLTAADVSRLTLPEKARFASDIFEITKDVEGDFSKPVTITIEFTRNIDLSKETLGLFWLDESKNIWVELDDIKIDSGRRTISGKVDHFTKFAAIAKPIAEEVEALEEVGTFSDTVNHWAESNILELVKLGAISGYEDGTFRPNRNITRAEFTSVLVNALGLRVNEGKVFEDTKNHWAKNAIATAYANGIIGGYDENNFGPNDLVTREQMAIMIVNAFKLESSDVFRNFTDTEEISTWAKESVEKASSNGVINGYPDGSFGPKKNATRGEAATIIVNALNKK